MKELLTASSRQRREVVDDDDDTVQPRRLGPGKLTPSDVTAYSGAAALSVEPGKLTPEQAGRGTMSPAQALRYFDWMMTGADRRAEPNAGELDDEGSLATAFSFLDSVRGGERLPEWLEKQLGAELGVDLSCVRVHLDDRAAQAAAALRAEAFTMGDDIYFAEGAYDPLSDRGIHLIAHEVAHVAQHKRAAPPNGARVSRPGDAREQEAEAFAQRFAKGHADSPRDADPAALVERVRREGQRIPMPFLDELEDHFATSFDFVELYAGKTAELACQALSASAFAIHNIIALADQSPRRDLLLHELTHVMQMGQRRAPSRFAPGSLGISDPHGAAEREATRREGHEAVASGEQIHRATTSDSGQTAGDNSVTAAEKSFAYFKSKHKLIKYPTSDPDKAGSGNSDEKFYRFSRENPPHNYEVASEEPFTLDSFLGVFREAGVPAELKKTDRALRDHLETIRKSAALMEKYRVSRIGHETSRKYAITSDDKWSPVVQDNATEERKKANPVDQFKAYFAAYQKLVKKNRLDATFKRAGVTLDTCTYQTAEVDDYRRELTTATAAAYIKDGGKAWDNFYAEVMKGQIFPPPYQRIQGNIFEEIVRGTVGVELQDKQPIFRKTEGEGKLSRDPRLGDDARFVPGGAIVIDAKAVEGGIDLEQARDYEKITNPKNKIRGYFKGEDVEQVGRTYTAVGYAVPGGEQPADPKKPDGPTRADRVHNALANVFVNEETGEPDLKRFYVAPNPTGLRQWLLSFNPTIRLQGEANEKRSRVAFQNPPSLLPGVTVKKATLNLDAPGGMDVKSGTVVMGINMAGAFTADRITKKIEPGGQVENKFDAFKSKLDDLLGPFTTEAKLTDDGVEAKITLKSGTSKIPQFRIDETVLVAKLTGEGQLSITGEVGLAHKSGKVSGKVKVGWAGGAWSFDGQATMAEGLVDGLQECTVGIKYENGKTTLYCPQAALEKKLKGVTIRGNAYDLEYDVDKGAFKGDAEIEADLGAFGKASADATIENNKIKHAKLVYDSPELNYPAKSSEPIFKGTVGGTIVYEEGKISGRIRGTADLNVPLLKKLGSPEGLGLAVDAKIGPDGGYSGTIRATKPIQLGEHFRLPSLSAELEEDGSANAKFAIEVVKIKWLDDAKIGCAIDKDGFRVTDANIEKTFGDKSKDRVSGAIKVSYAEGKGLQVGGTLAVKIREGFVATGTFTYDTETNKVSALLTTEEIPLVKMDPVEKTLFEVSRKIPIVNVYGIGVYIDIGFDLKFNMDFNLGMKPAIELEELSLETFDYKSLSAEVQLIGHLLASLVGTPKVGLGIFVFHPDLLSGGGGVMVPIAGKLELAPSGTFRLNYTPDGGVEGGAKLGLALSFGITGAVKPYAEFSVLKDMYNPKWTGEPLTEFTILPPREIVNLTLDLGGDLSKPKDVPLPEPGAAKEASEPQGDRVYKNDKQADERETSVPATPQPEESMPADPGKTSPGFDIDMLMGALKGFGPVQTLDKIIKTAAEVWEKITGAIGFLVKIVKNWFNDAVEAIEGILRGIAEKGLVGFLGDVVKDKMGDRVYKIVQPLFDRFAAVEDKMMMLLDEPFPSSIGDAPGWIWRTLKTLLSIGWESIDALVSAIPEVISNISDAIGDLLTLAVERGMIGVERHVYGAPLTDRFNFLAASEYKIDILGSGIYFKEPGDLNNPRSAIGFALYHILEEWNVPPTTDAYSESAGEYYRDRWVGGRGAL